jgi:hypothetical protein
LGKGAADGRGPPGMAAAAVAPTLAARAQDAGWGGWAAAVPIRPKAGERGGAGHGWEPAGPWLRAGPRERGLDWAKGEGGGAAELGRGTTAQEEGERGEFPSFIYMPL